MIDLRCEEKFSMCSTYSYTKELESTILASIPSTIKCRCPMRKIIRSICSLIKLNPLECCLLAWLLARSKYDFDKVLLDSRSLPLKAAEEEYEMKVFVFLLMNAYYVKEFLN